MEVFIINVIIYACKINYHLLSLLFIIKRYCILYLNGGIYLDIKTELVMNIENIFDHKKYNLFYAVVEDEIIYNGILLYII